MTDKITPEAVKARLDEHRHDPGLFTDLEAMAEDLATAYLAQAEEIERLRKRVEAADRLVAVIDTAVNKADDGKTNTALEWLSSSKQEIAAYRATEDET